MQSKKLLACLLLATISVSSWARDAQGGGFADRGIKGKWYDNSEFKGTPVFERKDVRIMFDWGETRKPGGSFANNFDKISCDNYSVQWEGTVIPRYSEEYTFYATVDDGATLKIRPQGGSWVTLIDKLNQSGEHKATFKLERGKKYDITMDYVERTGKAKAFLEWSGASFPREVIEPVIEMSLNIPTYNDIIWANGFAGARNRWEKTDIDEKGNPTGDGEFIFWEILSPFKLSPQVTGTMTLSFTGKAKVSARGMCYIKEGSLKYAPETNTTTATVIGRDNGANTATLIFQETSRDGTPNGAGGITNFKLMLPDQKDNTKSLPENYVFNPVAIDAFNRFTGLRFQRVNDQTLEWEDRTPVFWPYLKLGRVQNFVYNERYNSGKWNLKGRSNTPFEYEIMLCNVTGNDYYVSTPHLAKPDFFYKLALLIKNGSDETGTPYPQEVANPVHPPLNPNLRVYVEMSNELWNFAQIGTYAAFFDLQQEALDHYNNNTKEGQLLDHDKFLAKGGKNEKGEWKDLHKLGQRWWTFKTAKISDEFRKVFGDDLMPLTSKSTPRVRPLFGWQYNNSNGTCSNPLGFMEEILFNSEYVDNPKPPNYYIYAGGGAGYYGASNKFGLIGGVPKDGGFETIQVDKFVKNPENAVFSFSGDAGVCTKGYLNMPEPLVTKNSNEINQKAVYLNGDGASVSFEFTAPKDQKSEYYGVVYQAVLPANAKTTNKQILSLLVDGKEAAVLTGRGTQPLPWTNRATWNRVAWWVGSWYFSDNIILKPGQKIKVEFKSLTNDTPIFIDKINMTSLDAFYSSEIPSGGSAMGQAVVGKRSHGETIMGDGRWAATYGLEYMTYEHGWSAGGDAGDTPLQVQAKYYDMRAADAQELAMHIFERSGGINATFGTYATWPVFSEPNRVFGALNVDEWPLVVGLNRVANSLPVDVNNGVIIPGATYGQKWNALSNLYRTKASALTPKEWASYNFVAHNPGKYRVALELSGGGDVAVSMHGIAPVIYSGKAKGIVSADVELNYGVIAIRVTGVSGTVGVEKIAIGSVDDSPEKLLAIQAKYTSTATQKAEVKNELWVNEDFGNKEVPLAKFKNAQGAMPWIVQGNDTTDPGYQVKTTTPVSKGAYITGGCKYLAAGVLPDFSKIPAPFYKTVDGVTGFGVIGTSVFTAFKARLDGTSNNFFVGWTNANIPHLVAKRLVGVAVHNNFWSLAIKDRKNNWIYFDSKVATSKNKSYSFILATEFTETGLKAELYIDGAVAASGSSDIESLLGMFVFAPGPTANLGSLDDLKIGDSLEAVSKK